MSNRQLTEVKELKDYNDNNTVIFSMPLSSKAPCGEWEAGNTGRQLHSLYIREDPFKLNSPLIT